MWYAKNLIWGNSQRPSLAENWFGEAAREAEYNWTKLCWLDSDQDNWTNGEELGDPCCIWLPGMKLPWWPATHPGKTGDTPTGKRFDQANCDNFTSPDTFTNSEEAFQDFFYAEYPKDIVGRQHPWYLIFYSAIMLTWIQRSFDDSRCISTVQAAFILVGVYLYVDLMSAFLHTYLDNCSIDHPVYGGQCRGTQYHHYHPRSQSLAPMFTWFCNPIAVGVTIPVLLLQMVPRAVYQYPPQMSFAITCGGLVWPLTYVFHELAHLPATQVPLWAQFLQAIGVALHPDIHKAHHKEFNYTWSVLAGILDFVPNFLAGTVYDRHDTSVTLGIIIALVSLPSCAQLLYLDRSSTNGKSRLWKKTAAGKSVDV